MESGSRWGFDRRDARVCFLNLIFYFPWTMNCGYGRAEQHGALTQHTSRAGRFSFSAMHFQQSAAQRTSSKKWVSGEEANSIRQWEKEWEGENKRSKWGHQVQQSRRKEIETFESGDRNRKSIAVTSADFFQFATSFFGISSSGTCLQVVEQQTAEDWGLNKRSCRARRCVHRRVSSNYGSPFEIRQSCERVRTCTVRD